MKRLFLIFLFLLISCPAWGATYFVSQTGAGGKTGADVDNASDIATFNAGTAPYDNLDDDTVYLLDTITSIVAVPDSGTSGHVIRIKGDYTGHAATINGAGKAQCIYLDNKNYITIQNITVSNAGKNIEGNGTTNGITISGVTSSGSTTADIWFDVGAGLTFSGNTLNQGKQYSVYIMGTAGTHATNVTVTGNTFLGAAGKTFTSAVYMRLIDGLTWTDNTITDWTLNGTTTNTLVYFRDITGLSTSGNHIGTVANPNEGYQYSIINVSGTIGNDIILGSHSCGIHVSSTGASGLLISGTTTSNHAIHGVNLPSTATNVTINDLISNNNTLAGISITGARSNISINRLVSSGCQSGISTVDATFTSTDSTISNTTGRGIALAGSSISTLIRPVTTASALSRSCIYLGGSASATIYGGRSYSCLEDGVSLNGSSTATIYGHHAFDNGSDSSASSGDGFTAHDTSVLNLYHSTSYGNKKAGVAVTGASRGNIINNTFYNNYDATLDDDYGIWVNASGNWNIKNNITANHSKEIVITGLAVGVLNISHNLYFDSRGGNAFYWKTTEHDYAGWVTASGETNSVNADPLFIGTANSNFHLQSGSPAKGAGLNVGLSNTNPPDIGAEPYQQYVPWR